MMQIMKRVALEMVFVSTVAGGRTQQQMNSIPEERKRRTEEHQTRCHAGKVVEMLHGMHTETRKRLRIRIAVMKAVNLLVHRPIVEKPVGEIKMETSPYGNAGER
jgi:hypothetical protein